MKTTRFFFMMALILMMATVAGCGEEQDAGEAKPAFDVKKVTPLARFEVPALAAGGGFFGESGGDGLLFAPDGKTLLAQTADDLQVFAVVASTEALSPLATLTGTAAKLTPDGSTLILVGDGNLLLYDMAALAEAPAPLATITGTSSSFSPDGRWLVVTSDTAVSFYDLAALDAPPAKTFESASYSTSPDERWLLVQLDESYQLFEWATFDAAAEPALDIGGDAYTWSDDGTKLAVRNSTDRTLHYVDMSATPPAATVLENTAEGGFAFSPTGDRLLFSGDTGIDFWEIATQERTTYAWEADGFGRRFSPDGKLIALEVSTCSPGYCAGELRVIDIATLEVLFTKSVEGAYLAGKAFSHDGRFFAYGMSVTGSWNIYPQYGTTFITGSVHVIDLASGEEIHTFSHEDGVMGTLFFSQDDRHLTYSTLHWVSQNPEWGTSAVHYIDLSSGDEEWAAAGYGLASFISEDDRTIATSQMLVLPGLWMFGGGDYTLDAQTGALQSDGLKTADGALAIRTVPDSNTVAFYDGKLEKQLGEITIDGATALDGLLLSPDDKTLLAHYTAGEYPDTKVVVVLYSLPE